MLDREYLYRLIPDKLYLKLLFKRRLGKKLNLRSPKTFNEKLQWLKLYDRNPLYTTLVDKYLVKEYVAGIIGEEFIIPTLGVWDNFDEIDFEKLPDRFVLKCTHDSGGVVIVEDKNAFDVDAARDKIKSRLKKNFYYPGREWPYKNVKPRIIAEQYLEDLAFEHSPVDYKLMCFGGKVECSFTCTERFSGTGLKVTFFDKDWKAMPFERHYHKSDNPIKKPEKYAEMVQIAEKLSKGIPFVRVDLYEVKGHIYFGELTLYPGCGFEEFNPDEWDRKVGDWVPLDGAFGR